MSIGGALAPRHCEERSDEAIFARWIASFAMTASCYDVRLYFGASFGEGFTCSACASRRRILWAAFSARLIFSSWDSLSKKTKALQPGHSLE
jgi:hypothetical protein